MYQFTEDLLIGIKEIDDEHIKLFQMLNEVMGLLQEGGDSCAVAKDLIRNLKEYASYHFAHEEEYMERIGDAELPRQKKEHAAFVEKLESYKTFELTSQQGVQVMNDLLTFMAKWLYRHIIGSDTMIGRQKEHEEKVSTIVFLDIYKTGITLIDDEHRELFNIIRETQETIEAELLHDKYDKIVDILNRLKDYTIMHFKDEEDYMESIGYPGLQAQKMAHVAFVDRLNEINILDLDDNQKEYLDDILEFLLNWLVNHILKMDKKIPAK